jgi:hypothetical protein
MVEIGADRIQQTSFGASLSLPASLRRTILDLPACSQVMTGPEKGDPYQSTTNKSGQQEMKTGVVQLQLPENRIRSVYVPRPANISSSRSCLVSSAGLRKSVSSTSTFFAMIVSIQPRTRFAVSALLNPNWPKQFVDVVAERESVNSP